MIAKPTIGIAGGGLFGCLLAWRLLRQGCKVSVYERDALTMNRSAGWTAAGMISPLSELVSAEPCIFEWGMASLRMWPEWIKALEEDSGCTVAYRQLGSIVVAHPRDQSELRQFKQALNYKLRQHPTESPLMGHLEEPDTPALRAMEPSLSASLGAGLFLPNEAQVHSRELLSALRVAVRKQGGAWYADHDVRTVEPGRLHIGADKKTFDWTIDVRGMGAQAQQKGLRGVRGEVMLIESKEVHFQRPIRLMHPRYKLYVVPRNTNQLFIGATEIEAEDYSPISLQSSLELGSALYTLNPALAEARILETASNCRPTLPDNLPRIDLQPGYLSINGLYRHGYLLAPALIQQSLSQLPFQDTRDTASHRRSA